MSEVETPKYKPTHVIIGHFVTGAAFTFGWRETPIVVEQSDGSLSEGDPLESCVVTETDITITKEDGTRIWMNKGHVITFQIGPYKEMPETVKQRLEEAKATPSPFDKRRLH